MDHGSYPYMYLVSVLFISSIPHLTLHPLHFFKMFLYLYIIMVEYYYIIHNILHDSVAESAVQDNVQSQLENER